MFNLLPSVLEILFSSLAIAALFAAHRRATKNLNFNYQQHSTSNTESWRWQQPETQLDLQLVNTPRASRINLPAISLTCAEIIMIGFGYAILTLLLWILGALLLRETIDWVSLLLLNALLLPIGWVALHMGSHVVWIELRPEQVIFTIKYGFFWLRTQKYPLKPHLSFNGKLQTHLMRCVREANKICQPTTHKPC